MQNDKLAIFSFIRQYGVAIFFGLLGIVFITIGLFQTFSSPVDEIMFEMESEEEIFVDVSGAVINPGVYSLKSNSRLKDAVISAGGLGEDADREHLDRQVNMARIIVDGEKIYIPYEGELSIQRLDGEVGVTESEINNGGNVVLISEESGESDLVNLNSASPAQLDSLPGVGPVTIEKIMNGRPYGSVEELLSRDVLGEATYEKVKDLVSVD